MKWNIAKISMPEPKNLPKAEETLCDIQNEKTSFLDRAIKLFNLSNFIKSGKKEEIETAVAETDYDKSRAWIPVALSYLKGFALTLAVCLAGHYFLGVGPMADGNLGTDTVNMMENVMGSLNFAGLVTATLGSLIAWSKPFRITDRNEKDLEEKQKEKLQSQYAALTREVDFEIMGMEKTLSEQAPDIQTAFNLAKEKACLSLQNEKLQKDLNSARAAADNDSGSGLALGLALGMALS